MVKPHQALGAHTIVIDYSVLERVVCARQEVAIGDGDVDREAMSVGCEGAGYKEIPRGLGTTVTTLDLSDNLLESVEPLARLQHVVNLRLRDNSIDSIHGRNHSASHGSLRDDQN